MELRVSLQSIFPSWRFIFDAGSPSKVARDGEFPRPVISAAALSTTVKALSE